MKKILFFFAVLAGSYTMSAQGFGGAISGGYLSEIEGFGGTVDLIYNIDDKWSVATDATYSVADSGPTRNKWFIVDLNARYKVFDEAYLLGGGEYLSINLKSGGLGAGSIGPEIETSNSEFGFNAGAGYKYRIIDNVSVFTEVKYVVIDPAGYFHARLGLYFDF